MGISDIDNIVNKTVNSVRGNGVGPRRIMGKPRVGMNVSVNDVANSIVKLLDRIPTVKAASGQVTVMLEGDSVPRTISFKYK